MHRFDIYGKPVSDESTVNTYTTVRQNEVEGFGTLNGDFLLLWTSEYQDTTTSSIYAQYYDTDGAKSGDEFLVNAFRNSNAQREPSVTGLLDGGFITVWSSYEGGDGFDIFGQRFLSGAEPENVDFQVNSYTDGSQNHPSVCGLLSSGFVVVWESYGQAAPNSYDIYGQVYDKDNNKVGDEFLVNTYTTGNQRYPQVTARKDGGWVVTWMSYGEDGYKGGIYSQFYDSTNARQGSEFRVTTLRGPDQFNPAVSLFDTKGVVVAWVSEGQDGDGAGVYAKVIT